MCKKLPVDGLNWVDDLSIFTGDFIKNLMKKVILVTYL